MRRSIERDEGFIAQISGITRHISPNRPGARQRCAVATGWHIGSTEADEPNDALIHQITLAMRFRSTQSQMLMCRWSMVVGRTLILVETKTASHGASSELD